MNPALGKVSHDGSLSQAAREIIADFILLPEYEQWEVLGEISGFVLNNQTAKQTLRRQAQREKAVGAILRTARSHN